MMTTTAFFNYNNFDTYADAATLTAVDTSSIANGTYAQVTNLGVYQLDKDSLETADGTTVIAADVARSKWIVNYQNKIMMTADGEIDGSQIGAFASVSLANGTVGAPSFTWASDQTDGWYRIGSHNEGYAINSTKVFDLSATAATFTGINVTLTSGNLTLSTGDISATTGDITAGSVGNAGRLISYWSVILNGSWIFAAADNNSNSDVTLSNGKFDQVSTVIVTGGQVATTYIPTCSVNTNYSQVSALIVIDATLTAAAMPANVVIFSIPYGLGAVKVRDIKVNYSASGLSGGGGDRLIQITDGTTIYNGAGITAALLGTPVNTVWGGTGNPLPSTVAANTQSAFGPTIYATYSGGTTNYTTGSVSITLTLERSA